MADDPIRFGLRLKVVVFPASQFARRILKVEPSFSGSAGCPLLLGERNLGGVVLEPQSRQRVLRPLPLRFGEVGLLKRFFPLRLRLGFVPLGDFLLVARLFLLGHRLLAGLDETKREVFILAELEGLTLAEISEALGVNQNTVASRLRAARREFEVALDEATDQDEVAEPRQPAAREQRES